MTDEPLPPAPEEPSEPVAVAPRAPRRDPVPWLYGLGFLILALAGFYIWQYPNTSGEAIADAPAIQAVQQHLVEIDGRLNRLEQRPVPDISKLTARVDALEGRMAEQTQVASRLDTLSGRIEALSGRNQTGLDATSQQIEALTARVASVESKADSLDASAKRLNRITRLQEAAFALTAGRPVGDIPNAPDALTRYAHVAPPTEEQLRLRFQQAKQTALAAEQPDETDAPFVSRVLEKAQGLITLRRGDDVVLGNQSAVILNRAEAALGAGDLRDAVAAIATLKGQPAQAMATWLSEAKALLSARSALAEMANQA